MSYSILRQEDRFIDDRNRRERWDFSAEEYNARNNVFDVINCMRRSIFFLNLYSSPRRVDPIAWTEHIIIRNISDRYCPIVKLVVGTPADLL